MFARYLSIIKIEWTRQLTYRLDFFGYRFANFLEICVQLIIWSALFQSADNIRGYTFKEMITYVVIGWLITFITHNYGYEEVVAREIKDGTLSNFLVKPFPYIKYISARVVGRSWMAFLTGVIMQCFLMLVLKKFMLPPDSWISFLIIMPMVVFGFISRFLFSVLVGLLAFWTTETNGMFVAYRIVQNFLSGGYFPLDLLPSAIARLFYLTPFIYIFFLPTQLYLGKISLMQGLVGLGVQIMWILFLGLVIYAVWKRGLRKYEGIGI